MIAICALCITVSLGSVQNVQAASKARYTIRKIQEKKTYKKSSATYSYELPQLKGKSAAVKKINKSLKSYYTENLKLKKDLLVSFIYRNGMVHIPSGQDTIEVGDTVMIVTTHTGLDNIQDILK